MPPKTRREARGKRLAKHADQLPSSAGLSRVGETAPKRRRAAETQKPLRTTPCRRNARHRERNARAEQPPDCRREQTPSSRSTTRRRPPTQEKPGRLSPALVACRRKRESCSVTWNAHWSNVRAHWCR